MKVTISRNDLLDAANKVKTIVSSKSALPILSHVLLEAEGNTLKLSATDLKVSIECSVDCTVHKSGSMTMSAARMVSIVSELPDADITFELGDNNVISLECGKIQTKLYSMSPDEFPPIRDFSGIEPIILPQNVLRDIFLKTSFAICTDQARYNLTGLLLEMKEGKLISVATDGRRMSLVTESESAAEGLAFKVIIPGKLIHELERLLSSDEDVKVYIDENQAAFAFDSMRLVTQLIEGNFPNYEMVVPKKHDKEVVVGTAAFTEGMRRTRTMTNDKFNSVKIIVDSGAMTLRVSTPEVGEYEEELPIEYSGEKVEIAFNPDFVLDVLRHIDTEKAIFLLKDAMSPGVIKPYNEAPSDTYVNVVMPIRL
ncbi:MAG: DNA polymerase III subunit beta [Candidatus Hydrogenedentota bacterium]